MGAVGVRRARLRGIPAPLLAVLMMSLAAMLILSATQLKHGGGGSTGGRRGPPRVLLQGDYAPGDGSDGSLFAGEGSRGGSQQQQQQQQWRDEQQEEPGALTGYDAAGAAGSDDGEEAAEGPLTLDDAADLSTFADLGTHCVITPQHSKVALLFLTHGDLPHDMTWTAWMREARGLLPRGSLAGPEAFCLKQCDAAGTCTQRCGRAAACNPLCVDALQRRWGPQRSPAVLQQQHLFTVYVHARPTLKDYPETSIFAGRLIPDRQIAKPGTHAVAAATKRLIEAAVLDSRNAWFVLAGDSTVPLYHPALFYQQIASEPRSRLDACMHESRYLQRHRSTPDMRTDRFNPAQHWRKSSQWFVLNRKHAEVMAHDVELISIFKSQCFVGRDERGRMHECVSDEHYPPSLLAMYGLDNETTCDASGGTFERWIPGVAPGIPPQPTPRGAPQPAPAGHWMVYEPGHVTAELITSMRASVGGPPDALPSDESELCAGWMAATSAARDAFINAAAVSEAMCPLTLGSVEFLQQNPFAEAAMDARCVLLARGFSRHAARWVHRVYRTCTADLDVLECSTRLTDRDNSWWS